jgi:CRISPR system Cascade subunit CasC
MKTLIEIHILQHYAPSNLNRDDTGAPKDALFGGSRRARISSQCLKRAVRGHFKVLVSKGSLDGNYLGERTKRLMDMVVSSLEGLGHPRNEAREKVRNALAAVELIVKEDDKTQYLLFLGQQEIQAIAKIVHEKWETISAHENETDAKKTGKAKKDGAKQADPELKKAMWAIFNGGRAMDIALFGRMLADMPEKNQNAACQVAHAISTHAVEREFDYYTAVDDQKPQDTAGADMIGTVEFNSACFYRYAVVDWPKLVENLQQDSALASRALRAFLEGFVTSEPSGKQNSFAAHNPPEFVAVSVRREGAPRNLANAFETAVFSRSGLMVESSRRLVEKAKQLQAAYGGEGRTFVLNLVETPIDGFGEAVGSLKGLMDQTIQAVQAFQAAQV